MKRSILMKNNDENLEKLTEEEMSNVTGGVDNGGSDGDDRKTPLKGTKGGNG